MVDTFLTLPRNRYRLTDDPPWLTPPDGWMQSLAEWVVWWWLTEGRRSIGQPTLRPVGRGSPPERGRTFFFQVEVPNLGNFQSEVTRVDFLIPGYGDAAYEALAIDPYNEFTHPDIGLDYFKRATLATQANIGLTWIHTSRLEAGDTTVIEAALAGRDESPRANEGI